MAYIHLVDKDMYEKVKQFLVCPYDLVVSQATQLGFVKMSGADGSGTSAMK